MLKKGWRSCREPLDFPVDLSKREWCANHRPSSFAWTSKACLFFYRIGWLKFSRFQLFGSRKQKRSHPHPWVQMDKYFFPSVLRNQLELFRLKTWQHLILFIVLNKSVRSKESLTDQFRFTHLLNYQDQFFLLHRAKNLNYWPYSFGIDLELVFFNPVMFCHDISNHFHCVFPAKHLGRFSEQKRSHRSNRSNLSVRQRRTWWGLVSLAQSKIQRNRPCYIEMGASVSNALGAEQRWIKEAERLFCFSKKERQAPQKTLPLHS